MTKEDALPHATNWNQEDAISYECASEAITHAMAIVSAEIDEAEEQGGGNLQRLDHLNKLQTEMASERASLHRLDPAAIRATRAKYGAIVRGGRAGLRRPAA